MNSHNNLKRRVLKMYPVKIIKTDFNLTGHQDEVINSIIAANTLAQTYAYALDNLNNTKQHIYIYTNNKNFNEAGFDPSTFPIPIIKNFRDGYGYHIHCMPTVDCTAAVKNNETGEYSEVTMRFPQPIVITVTQRHLIIKATIIEKNIGSYMAGGNSESFNVKKSVEDDFTSAILSYFAGIHTIGICDINKGIKKLVDDDILDFKSLKIFKNQSTATEVMHEDKTFKQSYPAEYANAMLNPLGKSLFKYLLNDDVLCSSFAADANEGRLSITIYPTTPNQIQNVISKILANN